MIPWRKWLPRCGMAAALTLILLVAVHQRHVLWNSGGQTLLAGKVKPQLFITLDTAVLLAPDGSLWACGGVRSSNLSVFPQPVVLQVPQRIGSDSDWTQLACGVSHTVALKNDGSLWEWGGSRFGIAGPTNGTPTRVGTETNWMQICAGYLFTLALKNDGSLWAWAYNFNGRIYDGTTNNRLDPTRIGTDRDWRTIAPENGSSFGIKSNGTIWAWKIGGRSNALGDVLAPEQILPGTDWQAISAHGYIDDRFRRPGGSILVLLKTNGTLWQRFVPSVILSANKLPPECYEIGSDCDWSEIYAGDASLFARKKDGSWWGRGENVGGQFLLRPWVPRLPKPRRLPITFEPWAFAAGEGTTLLLGRDGKLWTWGLRLGANITDEKPFLLWELPAEMRRSLGTATNESVMRH